MSSGDAISGSPNLTGVLAEHHPTTAAGRGEGRQRRLCLHRDLPAPGRALIRLIPVFPTVFPSVYNMAMLTP